MERPANTPLGRAGRGTGRRRFCRSFATAFEEPGANCIEYRAVNHHGEGERSRPAGSAALTSPTHYQSSHAKGSSKVSRVCRRDGKTPETCPDTTDPAIRRSLSPQRGAKPNAAEGPASPPAAPPAIPPSAQSAEISAGLSTDLIHAAAQPSAVVEHPPAPTYDKRSLAGGAGASTPMRAKALQARLSANAFRSRLQGAVAQPGALWSISPEGKLQRSEDGGKNWQEVGVDDKVEFRVIQVNGRDIWAGGTGGACITQAMAARLGPVSTRLQAPLPPQKPSSRSVAPHPTFNRSPSKPPPGRSGYPTTAASTGER